MCAPSSPQGKQAPSIPSPSHPRHLNSTPRSPAPHPVSTSEPLPCCSPFPESPSSPLSVPSLSGSSGGHTQAPSPPGRSSQILSPLATLHTRFGVFTTVFLILKALKALEKMSMHVPITVIHRLLMLCLSCLRGFSCLGSHRKPAVRVTRRKLPVKGVPFSKISFIFEFPLLPH